MFLGNYPITPNPVSTASQTWIPGPADGSISPSRWRTSGGSETFTQAPFSLNVGGYTTLALVLTGPGTLNGVSPLDDASVRISLQTSGMSFPIDEFTWMKGEQYARGTYRICGERVFIQVTTASTQIAGVSIQANLAVLGF